MGLVTSSASTNNHNLYFSKDELAKILNLYSKGVSNGEWKDYAIDFNKNNAFFYIFKHSLAAPECILNKSLERKKRKFFYNLKLLVEMNFGKRILLVYIYQAILG